jgi:hypothetical protein
MFNPPKSRQKSSPRQEQKHGRKKSGKQERRITTDMKDGREIEDKTSKGKQKNK